jgi:asparagine synthetase B (glutamine-hydrolysing)
MPGILGVIGDSEIGSNQENRLAAMAYPLVFSPDQEVEWFRHEWYCVGTVGYGKSFSFLKKSSAYKDGVLLIMDGEVFPEAVDVPHELAAPFPTVQRAEYCLFLYLRDGPLFARSLNGNFVIAVLDNRDRTVHLYNDRFGSEPIYLWAGEREFAFATSQRSLLNYQDRIGRQYDKDALAELIVFERVLGNKTLFQDIRRMVPASHAMWNGAQWTIEKYWNLTVCSKPETLRTWRDAATELNRRLEQSMTRRLSDNAPAAALISGGIDSRLLLHHCSPSTIAATFSNRDHPPSIETRIATKIAQMLGHQHVLIERETDHYAGVAELAVDVHEGERTFMGCHSLGVHQQMLDAGIRVVLTAFWWDTLFKGYFSMGDVIDCVYRDGPSVLKSRRIAWHLSNSGAIRKLHHQHLLMLALNDEMRERAAVVKERVIAELFRVLCEEGECENRSEYFTLRDLQSRADIGFQRALRTWFPDRSPAYDNELLTFGSQIPVDWKKDGQIVRWALRLANRKVARVKDANTGLPASLCPPWNSFLGSARDAMLDVARWLSRYSRTVAGFRDAPPGCKVFSRHGSWHDMDGMLRLCERYRSLVRSTIEQLDETIFDKSMIIRLFRDDLGAATPRLHKLFEILLTFGLFDQKWGPSANRGATRGGIANMSITDLGSK